MMWFKKKTYSFIFCVLVSSLSFNQNLVTNGGFEGPDGIEKIPFDWYAGCGVMNTPDTQPGWWNVENDPYEGKSYLNLLYKEDGTKESVYQKLQTPLEEGACYIIEIHLAKACQEKDDLYTFGLNNPGDLTIRGSVSYGCANGEVLAEFEQVANCEWQKYYAVFQADSAHNYIYLEFDKGISPTQNGSILIDEFILENIHPLPDQYVEANFGTNVNLSSSVTPGFHHTWIQDDVLVSQDVNQINLLVEDNSVVEVIYFSADSCLISEQFFVYVKPQVPNIITPTGNDGVNDTFFISGLVETNELFILNRWGELVYYEQNYGNSWKGEDLVPGVYFYRLDLGETGRSFNGFVTVQ